MRWPTDGATNDYVHEAIWLVLDRGSYSLARMADECMATPHLAILASDESHSFHRLRGRFFERWQVILKDFYCAECHATVDDVEVSSASVCTLSFRCDRCERVQPHVAQCNGGIGKRYRYCDWDVREVSKGVEFTGVHACYSRPDTGGMNKSDPVIDLNTGKRLEDDPRFSADSRAEKRERLWHARDKRDGKDKIISTKRVEI